MKVAILGPIAWRTPPRSYGPWERVAGLIASGLHERGVDVTLFATLDSETPAKLDGVCPAPYAEDPSMDGRVWEALHVAHAFERSGEFDVVHNHLDWLPLAFEHLAHAPLVTTIHGFSGPTIMPVYEASTSALVSISYHWNNFLWPLIITNSVESRPVTVGLQVFSATDQGIDWSIINAATLMTTGPLLIAFLLFQRQFVQSFMRAGIR